MKDNDQKEFIDDLLASDNINGSIIDLDNSICRLCSWGDDLEKLTEQQKLFYYNQELEREVNNGGFNQYFLNSSGNYAHQTIVALNTIGAKKTANILQAAIDQFPDSMVPDDRDLRQTVIEQIGTVANEIWEELDQKFFIYEDNLNELNIRYIKDNRSAFY